MTQITATLVKTLRERTGAGMMDCKKALTECNADLESSIDWLRKKGLSAASKKAGRVAAEGLVAVSVSGEKGVVLEVNAETDFVGRNDQFQSFVSSLASHALSHGESLESLLASPFPGGSRTCEEELTHLISVIGENMTVRRVAQLSVSKGVVAGYVHNSVSDTLGRIAVIVGVESDASDKEALTALGRKIAMHVAAANPQSLSIESLDVTLLDREKAVLVEQAKSSGKPESVIEKMVEGRLRKFYEEVVLLEQPFIMDNDKKVKDIISDTAKTLGSDVTVSGYVVFKLGEGIEKKEDDFASEVSNLAK